MPLVGAVFVVLGQASVAIALAYGAAFVGNLPVPASVDRALHPAEPVWQRLTIDIVLLAIVAAQHVAIVRDPAICVWGRRVPPFKRWPRGLIAGAALGLLFWQWRPLGLIRTAWHVQGTAAALLDAGFWTGWLLMGCSLLVLDGAGRHVARPLWQTVRGETIARGARAGFRLGLGLALWSVTQMTLGRLLLAAAGTIIYGFWHPADRPQSELEHVISRWRVLLLHRDDRLARPGDAPVLPAALQTRIWRAVLIAAALSLLVSYLVACRALVLGSEAGGWIYEYAETSAAEWLATFAAIALVSGLLTALLSLVVGRFEWPVVIVWVIAAVSLQGQLRHLAPYSLEQLFVSDGSNGYYTAAQQSDASSLLEDFERRRLAFPSIHAQVNMPGKVMLVHALEQLSTEPAVLAWLVLVVSSLGALFMYGFVRDLFDDRIAALYAAILYSFVPSRLFFLPAFNTVTPVLALGGAWLWARWLKTRAWPYAAALGVVGYVLAFYEPTPLVLVLLFGGLTAQAVLQDEMRVRTVAAHGLAMLVGFLAMYAAMVVWFDFDLAAALHDTMRAVIRFNGIAQRSYGIWIWQNLVDFLALGAGICQAALWFVAVVLVIRGAVARSRSPIPARFRVFCIGLAGVLLAIDLIGINRGEVVRLWLFLACFFQIPAAYLCARHDSRLPIVVMLGTTLLMNAVGTAQVAFLKP